MKVKTLLATIKRTEYRIENIDGYTLEEDFISDSYGGFSDYEDNKVASIHTAPCRDVLVITIK